MSQTTVVDLDEVLINADRLIESHTKRNPQAGLLNECSREIERLSVDGLRAPSQMRLARIAFVLGDTIGAVEHLTARVVDGGETEAAAKANFAVEIAQSVGGRRPRDAHPLPRDVKGLLLSSIFPSALHGGAITTAIAVRTGGPLQDVGYFHDKGIPQLCCLRDQRRDDCWFGNQ